MPLLDVIIVVICYKMVRVPLNLILIWLWIFLFPSKIKPQAITTGFCFSLLSLVRLQNFAIDSDLFELCKLGHIWHNFDSIRFDSIASSVCDFKCSNNTLIMLSYRIETYPHVSKRKTMISNDALELLRWSVCRSVSIEKKPEHLGFLQFHFIISTNQTVLNPFYY